MTVQKRWRLGIAFTFAGALCAAAIMTPVLDWRSLAAFIEFGCMSLAAVAFSAALVQQEREAE